MIRHLLVFNTAAGVTHEECVAMAEKGRQELSRISGVLQVSFGVALKENARYRYNFVIDLIDEQALRNYIEDPIHVKFANELFRPMAPDRITTDYETLY